MPSTTTWDEIRMTVLRKLFLSTGDTVIRNDSNRDYLDAMPAVYNEAVMSLSTTNRYITKHFEVPADGLTGTVMVDLASIVDDFFQMKPDGIYFTETNGNTFRCFGQEYIDNDLLLLDGKKTGVYRIYYHAYPKKATAETKGTEDMQLDPDVAVLVPLYMASQLYKDDDIAVATQYRNEFEMGREDLTRERNGRTTGEFISTTGWC